MQCRTAGTAEMENAGGLFLRSSSPATVLPCLSSRTVVTCQLSVVTLTRPGSCRRGPGVQDYGVLTLGRRGRGWAMGWRGGGAATCISANRASPMTSVTDQRE